MYGIPVLFCRVASLCRVRNYSEGTKKLLKFLAEMPKSNSARIVQAQRQRIQISKKSEKYGPSTVYLQVLGSGARGGPNTLYLFTDQKRYLFNCGECTQRLAHEHKVKLSRLDHIFITNKTWRNIGGLPGLSLTLQDVGVPNITLHGPEGLDDLYQATKRFVIMKDMNVTMAECSPSKDFEDNVMTVKYILLGPLDDLLTDKDLKPVNKKSKLNADKQFEEFIHDDTDYYRPIRHTENKEKPQTKEKPKQHSSVIDPMMKKTEKVLQELQKISNASVAYICTLKKRLGTLDLEKCVERGVKPGPLLGLLKQGQDVVLPDGTLVLSKDVKTPDDPGPVFIVIDLPDISYLKESEFSAHFDNGTNPTENIPTLLVHFTAPDVMQHPRYRQFMSMFGPTTQHLILNQQNSCLGSEAVHRTQHKLHLLDPDIFPMLRDISVPAVWTGSPPPANADSPNKLKGLEELKNKIALAQFQNIVNLESSGSCKGDGLPGDADSRVKFDLIAGRTLTMFHLRPKIELDRSAEPKLHIQDYIQETMSVDGFVPSLDKFRQLVESVRYEKGRSMKEYPKVVFLGTGSCIPSKTRNTSAIVLHIDESRSLLMDCGEGTFGQLVRFYGPKKVNAFLRTLKGIYISHLHADHHIGLIGVLQARRQACEEVSQEHSPLYLLAPGQIVTWLTLYDEQFEKIRSDFTLIPNQNLLHTVADQRETMTPVIQAHLGVQHIKTCLVAHCPNAFGVAIELDADNKITYSGDTLPCEELVKIGKNSSLLIHEATMEDELSEEARTKMHSTTSQAIEVGRQMGARYTVLTHFSQRYARLPRLNSHILNDNNSVGIAFDNMQVTMSELELLPHMYAPLQLMFVEHCVEMELKAAQRARHKERRASSPNLPPIGPPAKSVKEGEAEPRWQGSGFRAANSSLYGTYVETYSSRLRREMRGKPVNGIVRTPVTCRSESVSPNKNTRNSSRQSSGAATPIAVPHAHVQLPLKPAPPCVNDKSKASSRAQDHHQVEATGPQSGTSVTSHRKPMSKNQTKCRSPTCDEVLNTMEMKARLRPSLTPTMCTVKHCDPTGYGKPLVTPVNKKLVIKRHQSPAINNMRKEGGSSPVSPRNNSPGHSGQPSRVGSATSKNRVAIDLDKETKSPTRSFAKEIGPGILSERTRSPPVYNSNVRNNKKGIESKSKDLKSSYTDKMRQQQGEFYRKIKVMNLVHSSKVREGLSPVKGSPLLDQVRKSYLPIPTGRCMDNRSKHRLHKTPDTSKQSLYKPSSKKDIVRDSSKQSLSEESCDSKHSMGGAVRHTHKSSSLSQNKAFKPQLEDIKSSFLILNAAKKQKAAAHNGQSDSALRKHKVISEDERKHQLREIKQKYQSKGFWIDSKYDKIEGLNWISWK